MLTLTGCSEDDLFLHAEVGHGKVTMAITKALEHS